MILTLLRIIGYFAFALLIIDALIRASNPNYRSIISFFDMREYLQKYGQKRPF